MVRRAATQPLALPKTSDLAGLPLCVQGRRGAGTFPWDPGMASLGTYVASLCNCPWPLVGKALRGVGGSPMTPFILTPNLKTAPPRSSPPPLHIGTYLSFIILLCVQLNILVDIFGCLFLRYKKKKPPVVCKAHSFILDFFLETGS